MCEGGAAFKYRFFGPFIWAKLRFNKGACQFFAGVLPRNGGSLPDELKGKSLIKKSVCHRLYNDKADVV
jgi:hypothetical protein